MNRVVIFCVGFLCHGVLLELHISCFEIPEEHTRKTCFFKFLLCFELEFLQFVSEFSSKMKFIIAIS
jgi:hypothetical protein